MYILAEKLLDSRTRNRMIDVILARVRGRDKGAFPNVEQIAKAYEHTPETSPIRRLFVDFYADNFTSPWPPEEAALLPKQFFVDVANRALERRLRPNKATEEMMSLSRYYSLEPNVKDGKMSDAAKSGTGTGEGL
ncbi:hypothetical protein K458DRAFT_425134 [Lentithecium fluviatile CBS 122367]|uniref:Uncharacterized protein n=1 Tax=Lentithecium fluviatile CBS 122367 TaxID=1168545 RepID=A0A6G1ICP1_9PLEO|nr:hypothetical protein K458DRAFT_425134 [Lentithecium fluviatile CBS 122367]